MKLKSTSFKLTEKRLANLKVIAASFGCRYNDAPSIGEMLNQIADGNLDIRRAVSGLSNMFPSIASKISSVQQPTAIPIQPPAWNAPVATTLSVSDLPQQDFSTYAMHPSLKKSEFVTDRGDGTFVDTEEFDKPVPQKRVPGAVEAFAGIFGMKAEVLPESGNVHVPSVSSNVEAMKNATKEQKIQAALAAMGSAIKKGSEL